MYIALLRPVCQSEMPDDKEDPFEQNRNRLANVSYLENVRAGVAGKLT